MTATPSSSYRLQLGPGFTLAQARDVVPYLDSLGISDVYLSPVFAARPGSTHGYDVVELNEIRDELGGLEAARALSATLRERGMRWLQDLVPNHQAYHGSNRTLMNVLELGPHSRFYRHFDILWEHPYENIRGRVLAPFLGDFYSRCLERGELRLGFDQGGLWVHYYDFRLPLSLRSYATVLSLDLERIASGFTRPGLLKLSALIEFVRDLDAEIARRPEFDFSGFVKEVLWELYQGDAAIRAHVDANLCAFNGEAGEHAPGELLDRLLGEQYFRLSYWKVGTEELNYRRFFSINDLISLRLEEREVFDVTHRLILDLVREGTVQGLRIDHVDGLYDPTTYLERLREACPEAYIVVEKILEPGERLPADWPIAGTTGYDFCDAVTALLCDHRAAEALERVQRSLTKQTRSVRELAHDNKRLIVERHMAGDVDNLALLLKETTNRSREGNDLTMYAVRRALVEILIAFPVYRTYVSPRRLDEDDRRLIERVIEDCAQAVPHFGNELRLIGSFIERLFAGTLAEEEQRDWLHFVMRLQQYTGPLMAKGVEDTTFYQYNRLLARNEVGSDPALLGHDVAAFHAFNQRRLDSWPLAMSTLSTHDTKRGEDTRARIAAIADDVPAWQGFATAWNKLNRRHKRKLGAELAPSASDELHLYQTLLGVLPFDGVDAADLRPRVQAYMLKAAREAKRDTSWLKPSQAYEDALAHFITQILDAEQGAEFLSSFLPYARTIAWRGICNSLTQTLLKHLSPGVPDLYQGAELWELNLVDPDNRGAVDFAQRQQLLDALKQRLAVDEGSLIAELTAQPEDGRLKLLLVHRLLQFRRQ
ncbi:MAG: malto-oligosyltrehalose synthase, partial [Pseudomonadota bacterium]